MPLDALWRDMQYGWRQLRRNPGFTFVAVGSLALGIGANTAIFQLVDAVRLRTLPVERPQDLVTVDLPQGSMRAGWFSTRSARLTSGLWEQIRTQQQVFSGVAAWSAARLNLAPGGEVRNAESLFVSGDFFPTLGVRPVAGRLFSAADDTATCGNPGAVISYAFWQGEFGGDTNVLGRAVSLNGKTFPVIGVTAPAFFGVEVGANFDVAIPLCADRLLAEDGQGRIPRADAWWLSMLGRLKPGVTAEGASAQLKTISPGIMKATLPPRYMPDMAKRYLANQLVATAGGTGVSNVRRQYERALWLLLAATGLVLLIACANLANLLLARASVREREIAVRLALGASRGRLMRQLLAESLLVAVAGATLGMLLAQALSRVLIAFISTSNNPLFLGLGLDWRVLGFTAALAVGTCLLFGLMPAIRATGLAPASAMRSGSRGVTAGRERFSLRRALVAGQMALCLVLLVSALLFTRSLTNLLTVQLGFVPDQLIVASVDIQALKYDKQRRPEAFRQMEDRLRSLPSVASVAQMAFTPLSGAGWNQTIRKEGEDTIDRTRESNFNRVGPGALQTLGVTLVAGRDFDQSDTLSSATTAIVNEEFAKKFLSGGSPIGRTFRIAVGPGETDHVYQVVGLMKNTKYYQLREDPLPVAFFPMAQDLDPSFSTRYVIRVRGNSVGDATRGVRSTIEEFNPAISMEFRSLPQQIKDTLLRERLMATLSGAFGVLAALLATLGLYGVISYMVARRRNEIGLRIALGAGRSRVLWLVVRESLLLVSIGLGVGSLLAVWAAQGASTLLFGLKPHDPLTLGVSAALLTAVALISSYWPARRAAALEPMQALREE